MTIRAEIEFPVLSVFRVISYCARERNARYAPSEKSAIAAEAQASTTCDLPSAGFPAPTFVATATPFKSLRVESAIYGKDIRTPVRTPEARDLGDHNEVR